MTFYKRNKTANIFLNSWSFVLKFKYNTKLNIYVKFHGITDSNRSSSVLKKYSKNLYLNPDVTQAVNFPATWHKHISLIDMLRALSRASLYNRCFSHFIPYIHSHSVFQCNNKKLFSLACYLTAVL